MSDKQNGPEAEEKIEISLEDLEEEPAAVAPAGLPPVQPITPSPDTLVIESHDLLDVAETPSYPGGGATYAPVQPGAYALAGKGKKGVFSGGLVGSLLIQMFIAGGLGGLLAWAINEPQTGSAERLGQQTSGQVFLHSLVFFAIAGGVIGLFLGAVEGVSTFNARKAAIGGGLGLAIGAVGGALAGLLGQAAYGALGGTGDRITIPQIMARTVGWAIAGLFIGLGQGAMARSVKKIINGLCGGALGGFAGGLLFDPIGVVMALTGYPGLMSRLLALVVIGAASGAAIGIIEELRKEAWVVIVGGPLTGKQFILYRAATTIGTSPACDIALLKDHSIAPQHCVIEAAGAHHVLRDLGSATGTFVNRSPVQRHQLRRGDVIQIGQTALEYQDRALQ